MATVETVILPNDLVANDLAVEDKEPALVGVMAEYEDVASVYYAAEAVRDAGYTRWDVHSPFPIHGIDQAMGARPTVLPWITLGGGIGGLLGGLFLTIYTMSVRWDSAGAFSGYTYLESGKPLLSLPQFIPPVFETTILLAAFSAGLGMLGLNALPMLYNPLFKNPRFRRVTDDRFFIVIDASDPKFDESSASGLLEKTNPVTLTRIED